MEAPRSALEAPRSALEAPRGSLGDLGLGGSFSIVKIDVSARDPPFRLDETRASVTNYRFFTYKMGGKPLINLHGYLILLRQDPYSPRLFGELSTIEQQ